MQEMKTKSLLWIIAAMGVAGMLLMAVVAVYELYGQNASAKDALVNSGVQMKALISVETANVEFKRQVQEWKDTLLRGNDAGKFDQYFANFVKRETSVDENLKQAAVLLKAMGLSADADKVNVIIQAHHELGDKYREALKSYDKSNPGADKVVDHLVAGMDRQMTKEITEFVARIETAARQDSEQEIALIEARFGNALKFFALILLAASLIVCTFAVIGMRSILNRLGGEPLDAANVAQRISQGDLSVNVPGDGHEHSLMAAMREMKSKLSSLVWQIQSSVDKVAADSHQLESSAVGLEGNSKKQSSAAESMAATMEEIATSIEQLSHSADSVQTLSGESEEVVQKSGDLIREIVSDIDAIAHDAREAVSAMHELEQRSDDISHIVQVIQEIAGQTNLLALNAAIEAARAGEQGRGFAVVADEVRKLAVRTSQSTQEIVDMIDKIHVGTDAATKQMQCMMERVNQSASRAGSVGDAIDRIQSGFQHTGYAIAEISTAIREQSIAVCDIAKNVEQVSTMSATNHAASIDLHGAVARIRDASESLQREARHFNLGRA